MCMYLGMNNIIQTQHDFGNSKWNFKHQTINKYK